MKKIIRKVAAITIAFAVAFTTFPIATSSFSADAYAATAKKITLRASASGQHGAALSWNKIKKPGKGYAVFRDGYVIAHVGKRYSFSDSGLAAATAYTYKVKAYKTKVKKTKMWYNKATGQYQKKKPAKRYRGKRKTFKKVTYKYSKVSNAVSIRTAAPPASAVTVPVPQNLSVAVDGTDLKISWSPVEGATGYKVYVDSYTFDADTTLASDGMKKKKITGVTAGTHTVQVAAVKGSAISAKSNKVTATVSAPGEEARDVTDYLGTTRHIVKKTDKNGNAYWEDDNQGSYLDADLAKIDRTIDGEFTISSGEVMWQRKGVTFIKSSLNTAYERSASIKMYNGDPDKLQFSFSNTTKTISTHDRRNNQINKTFIMNGNEFRLVEEPGTSISSGLHGETVVEYAFPNDETVCECACTGCGFTKGTVNVTISYDGIGTIANWSFAINPEGVKVNSGRDVDIYLSPFRKQYWDIAMAAIPEIKTGDYDRDMNVVAKYIEDNYTDLEIDCVIGTAILETYSVCAYGVYGYSGLGQVGNGYYDGDIESSMHSAFHLDSDPNKWYEANGLQ